MPEEENKNTEKEESKKEAKPEGGLPLFSDEVFKDKLDLGEDDLDKLPV